MSEEMVVRQTQAGTFRIPKGPLLGPDQMPMEATGQKFGVYTLAATWFAATISVPALLLFAGGLLMGLNWIQVWLAFTLAGIIIAVLFQLTGHAGTRYGIPHTVLLRAAFGNRAGVYAASITRAAVALIWYAIQTWIIAFAFDFILSNILAGYGALLTPFSRTFILWLIFYVVQYGIFRYEFKGLKILEEWGTPLLMVLIGVGLVWGYSLAGSWGPVFQGGTKYAPWGSFTLFMAFGVTSGVSGWSTWAINASDVTRTAKSPRVLWWSLLLGFPLGYLVTAIAALAIISVGEAMGLGAVWNPVEWAGRYPNVLLGVILLLLMAVGSITTNWPGNLLAGATTLANLFPRQLNFHRAQVVAMVISLAGFPWFILAHPETYLTYVIRYGGVLGAILGVMLADYWLFRRGTLDLPELYREKGRFLYWNGGINWLAIAASLVGVVVAYFTPTWSVFVSLAVAFVVYALLTWLAKGRIKEVTRALQ